MVKDQGDLIKVGNTDCATMTGDPNDWTTWGYAWETTIVPIIDPNAPMPEEATIDFSDILFWVGEGTNEAVMAVNWADTAAGMTTPLSITPGNWWGSTNNGFMDMGLGQTLADGDLEKWADPVYQHAVHHERER